MRAAKKKRKKEELGWDEAVVKRLYRNRPAAKALMDDLRASGEAKRFTSVDELVEKYGMARKGAIGLLRRLEAANCGKFRNGRRGRPSRLIWGPSSADVATTAADPAPAKKPHLARHQVWLRPGVKVTLPLPLDLTKEEAERLARVVGNLWAGAQN